MAQLNDLLVTGGARINSDALLDSDLYVTNGYIRGENSQTTNHAIQLGHAGSDLMNFYEYGGVFNFYKSTSGTNTLLGKINTSGWVGSAALSGTPTAPTAASGTATTQIATTAFVDSYFAKKASPALTGTPTAPTATAGTNTTQIATTAFVTTAANTKQTKITYSTTDLTAGTSDLATGELYVVYE